MEYTKQRNLNRGYMKPRGWQRGMDLFALAFRFAEPDADFKRKSPFTESTQSLSAKVAEGYGRRTLPEYMQFLCVARESLGEALNRVCGLLRARVIPAALFEVFDQLPYEVENNLLALIGSLDSKRETHTWQDALPSPTAVAPRQLNHPLVH